MTYRTAEPLPDRPRCPRDGAELEEVALLLPRRICPACRGVWLDREAARTLVSEPTVQAAMDRGVALPPRLVDDPSRKLRCLTCREPMHRFEYGARSRVLVDACRDHGVWFDARELAEVATYLLHHARLVPLEDAEADAIVGPRPARGDYSLGMTVGDVLREVVNFVWGTRL